MIELEGVAARQRPLSLSNLTAAWGPGVHALLGARTDGGPLVLALVAGALRPRAGTLRVLDATPADPGVRRRIARIPFDVALPEALRVDEALALASRVRREPGRPAVERLAELGVESLAHRAVRSLSRAEARAVALAEAVTSAAVRILLVEEPFVAMDPRACARLAGRLRALGDAGCAVLVDTASPRDAGELAGDHVILRAGTVAGRAASMEELVAASPGGARLRIVARDADGGLAIGQALAGEGDVDSIERQGASVVARGPSAARLARAAERAIVRSDRDVTEIRLDPPSLDEARTLASALVARSPSREGAAPGPGRTREGVS